MTAAPSHRANPWLDLVRALAIMLVLFRHGQRELLAAGDRPEGVLETIALNGWIGVDLFFVLSGYLIARHLLRAGIGTPSFAWGRYLALRALRILPAYYAVLLLVVAGAFPLYRVDTDDLGFRLVYHLAFLQDYLTSDINVVFWSLGVEEKFYLLAPLLIAGLLGCRSHGVRMAILLGLFTLPLMLRAAGFFAADHTFTYPEFWRMLRSPFHMALEGFAVGVGIAIAQNFDLVRLSRRAGLAVLAGATMALFVWMSTHEFMAAIGPGDALIQPPLIALLAGAMVLGGVMLAGTPMPAAPPIRFVAKLAYVLYLVHYPLIPLARALAPLAGFWAAYIALSFAAALLVHRAVEKPFLDWKDRIAARPPGQAGAKLPKTSEA